MADFCKEQQKVVHGTESEVVTRQAVVQPIDRQVETVVGYDRTTLTRGHKSRIVTGIAVDMATGFVLDFEVDSIFYKSCSAMKKNWKLKRDLKSGERRSENMGFRYTKLLGDGDSSAYNAVTNMNNGESPYSLKVEKEECL